MKKWMIPFILCACLALTACHQKNTYDRNDPDESYERFINSHVFAACEAYEKPYARYSLAELLQRPSNDSPAYKIKFINGPCKGVRVWTTHVITKTRPIDDATLIETGTPVLRNFDNPKQLDKNLTDHWNVGVVVGTERAQKGILDVGFPRDGNDFFPARESVYAHNLRVIEQPAFKDIRNFIN